MRIATWNINSVRLRIHHVLRFIKEQNIDVMCLQETKTPDEYFPHDEFEKIGFINQEDLKLKLIQWRHLKEKTSYLNQTRLLMKLDLT